MYNILIEKKLPKGYHTDYDEVKNKYFWYYLGKQGGGHDFSNKKYYIKHNSAVNAAIKHHEQKNKK